MYESKPRRREGEPIEALVGEAIELTASRSGSIAGDDAEGGLRERAGKERGSRSGGAAGAWAWAEGRGLTLPWDGWSEDRLRGAFLVAVVAAAVEALALIAVLIAALT